jgi:hypothetical protein
MKTEDLAKLSTIVLKSVTSVVIPGSQLKEESDTDPSSVVSPSCSGKRARSTTLLQEGSKLEPQCHLTRIPMELLAEILLYLPSTKCILAVARCSKYFCDTLVTNKSSVFIWRNVRAACKPYAIPEPTPNFTEPAYAAFIFDGGECEVRGTTLSFDWPHLQSIFRFARRKHLPCIFHLLFGLACVARLVSTLLYLGTIDSSPTSQSVVCTSRKSESSLNPLTA